MSDHQSDATYRRRRRLLITLGAGLAGAYVAPTLVNVAGAHPGPHRHGSGSFSRPSYSRPSGKHHHHHGHHEYRERRYYRDDRRHHHHRDSELRLNILLHPSRW
ncbi:hypothetical protein LV475_00790 [Guyparkeria hydrothermalis]|uniref:hypothetical protein n=1 Tax=Guyparkeria TaxID=2035712 RepID=UPI0010AC5613|nr:MULTISPECIES: hypothetical protein [Guyparkeria]MCL7750146.1 hypothetical protein [Guyparkeria hydrothermalis]TKA89247.1 hypothetical protein FAZ79_06550 [Guyparkeria sp. SB14A]